MGTLERDRIELVADSSEPIRAILVREGQSVIAGEALVQQGTEKPDVALVKARADEQTVKAALAQAEKGPRSEVVDQGRARLQATKSARATALHELERQKSLVEKNLSAESSIDILQGRYDESVAGEQEAQAALDELLAGTRNEIIDQARSRYAAAAAIVKDLAITLRRATITSPVSGTVEVLPFEIGERPRPGNTVAVVLADKPVYARIHVPEPLRARIIPGTVAKVHVQSIGETFSAEVRWVAADASFTPFFSLTEHDRSRLSFLAEVDLTSERSLKLPVGIPVQVTFPDIDP